MADKNEAGKGFSWGSVSEITNSLSSFMPFFNTKGQQNQVAIAEANARAEEAKASTAKVPGVTNTVLYLVIGAIVFLVLIFLFKSKQQ